MVTARDLQDVQDHLINTTTAHGVTGAVVGTTNSQTLTGKAINGPDNNLTNIAQASVTNLVSDLSNRSLTSHTHTLTGITDVTASAAELNILDGVTSSTAELNILDGVVASTAELNYVDGVTSAIQTQLDAKAPIANPTFTTLHLLKTIEFKRLKP
jgi:subtilase family serine protease